MVSLTGISSGRVTRATWHRSGSDSRSTTSAAWARIGSAPGRVEQTAGRRQERHGVAGGRGVHQDQVGLAASLDLLHLPEHQDVPDARDGAGHQVDDPRRHQAFGDPLQAVVGQVFEQRIVGGDSPGPDGAGRDAPGPVRAGAIVRCRPGRLQHRFGVVEPVARPEGGRHSAPALELDHQHRQAGARGQVGQRRDHGRLAHASLAGHDQDPALTAERADVHDPLERSVPLPPPLTRPDGTSGVARPVAPLGPKCSPSVAVTREILIRPLVSRHPWEYFR